MSFIVTLQTQKDNPCVLFGEGGGVGSGAGTARYEALLKGHIPGLQNREENDHSAKRSHQQVDRLQAQLTGRCHSAEDWVWAMRNSNDGHQFHMQILKKVTTCFSKRRNRSEPLYEPKLNLFMQVGESMSNPGFILFFFFFDRGIGKSGWATTRRNVSKRMNLCSQ